MVQTNVRTNLALKGGLSLHQAADFPANVKGGATCLRDGVLYVRTTVDGLGAWLPLNAPQSSYAHTQGAAAQVWQVEHGFTGVVSVLAYGQDGNPIPATVTHGDSSASIDVGSARTGYAVAFGLDFLQRAATAADADKLGGIPASDYLTVNDRIDLGEL